MNKSNIILTGFTIASFVTALVTIVVYRYKIKANINRMNDMLDRAISGSFSESSYDESRLSALEAKLSRFLSMSLSSENNLATEKERIKGLISDISHQTKTPIANILLYSQLLNEQEDLPNSCSEMMNQITIQSEKLDFLIQALVKMSRLETDIISVIPKLNSVLNLVTDVYNKVKKKVEDKNLKINTIDEDCMAIFDKKWTEEALYNIIDNAIKYTPEGGDISVSVIPYEMFYKIDVVDNGVGIREGDINSIFKRFYRSIDVNEYEGVGIGLFLAREIITKQGGYIKVSSIVGKGSTFSIFLPK
ncbi:two-component sensor histidine kinase [Clostridium aceticum]|uniref:histidine kinase n=1 Tax=Clostridium aceticum TaxID=84022 RepID=A0A0D8I8J8_9CLOT|nr:HAMP domain-containing sensor histidine kinase [Clostridium aceticum]AKL97322.1 two-component sensor histidine kinase [Clostridium aceticum]KJF26337.1 histidine kinase [Clostridium aceticum]